MQRRHARVLVVLVQAQQRRADAVVPQQVTGAPGVLGGDQRRPRAGSASARSVMSSRLPIGVATTNSVPVEWPT